MLSRQDPVNEKTGPVYLKATLSGQQDNQMQQARRKYWQKRPPMKLAATNNIVVVKMQQQNHDINQVNETSFDLKTQRETII